MTFKRLKPFIIMLSSIMIAGVSLFFIDHFKSISNKNTINVHVNQVEAVLAQHLHGSFKYDLETFRSLSLDVSSLKNYKISPSTLASINSKYNELIKKTIEQFADCEAKLHGTILEELEEFVIVGSMEMQLLDDIKKCNDFDIKSLLFKTRKFGDQTILERFNPVIWNNYLQEKILEVPVTNICVCNDIRDTVSSSILRYRDKHNNLKVQFDKIMSNLVFDSVNYENIENFTKIRYKKQIIKRDIEFNSPPYSFYSKELKKVSFKTNKPINWP
jgi:hypothetical protein